MEQLPEHPVQLPVHPSLPHEVLHFPEHETTQLPVHPKQPPVQLPPHPEHTSEVTAPVHAPPQLDLDEAII